MLLFNESIININTDDYRIGDITSESTSISIYPMLDADAITQEVQTSNSGVLQYPVTKEVAIYTDQFATVNGQTIPLFFKYTLPVSAGYRYLLRTAPELCRAQFFVEGLPIPTKLDGNIVYVAKYDINKPCYLQYDIAGKINTVIPKLAPVLQFETFPITYTASGYTLAPGLSRVWVTELAHADVIWKEDNHVCMSIGTYGGIPINTVNDDTLDPDYSLYYATKTERAKVSEDGTYLILSRNPVVSIQSIKSTVTIERDQTNYMAGRIYLRRPIRVDAIVEVEYTHIVREVILTNPNLALTSDSTAYIIGTTATTPTYTESNTTRYCTNQRLVPSTTAITTLGTAVVKGSSDTLTLEQNVHVGGGVDAYIDDIPEADFFMDIGYEDGPPLHGSKILQATLPARVKNKIAFWQTRLRRTQSDCVARSLTEAASVVTEKLGKIKPAGALYVDTITDLEE